MRCVFSAVVAVLLVAGSGFAQYETEIISDPETPHLAYRFEGSVADGHRDLLTLRGSLDRDKPGEIFEGKILEWGNLVYFWDRGDRKHTFRRTDVRDMKMRTSDELSICPSLPDLTVAFVERLPRDPGWHDKVKYGDDGGEDLLPVLKADPTEQLHREPGEPVEFVVHVLNAGGADAPPFDWEVLIDDEPIASGSTDAEVAPRGEILLEAGWKWEEGQHLLTVRLDPGERIREIAEWNNTFHDPTRALTYFFAVSRATYEGFAAARNCVDTFCFEDWAQHHVHMMNWLFERSVYPSAPDGILERVRIDNIIVVEDSRDPELRKEWDLVRRRNNDPDDLIMYNGNWEFGTVRDAEHAALWAADADWGLPHELGHQLGLVDIYQLNTDFRDCLVRSPDGGYLNCHHFFPRPATMMHWHGPHTFSEQCAGYLNQTLGRPRGYFGDYLWALPRECALRILGNDGRPVAGARITLYQRHSSGDLRGRVGPDPIAEGVTDGDGRWVMPNRPVPEAESWEGYTLRENPWGVIDIVGRNGTLLAAVEKDGCREHHWIRIFDFNVARFRGHEDEWTWPIDTAIPPAGTPEPPADLRPVFHHPATGVKLSLAWSAADSAANVVEYNVYRKASHGGDSVKPFRRLAVVPADKVSPDGTFSLNAEFGVQFQFDGFYSLDNYFAVTAVDSAGRESALSRPIYVPKFHDTRRLAMAADGTAFFTVAGGNENQVLRWTEERGTHELGLRCLAISGYRPGFGGIAIDPDDRLVVTDTFNHQLACYDRDGDLQWIVGKMPRKHEEGRGDGETEFNEPSDVAIDPAGRIYVADTRNARVQVFDPDGSYRGTITGDADGDAPDGDAFAFGEPTALGCSGTFLSVTDRKAGTVTVYDVATSPTIVRRVDNLREPDRALLSPSGRLYVTARNPDDQRWCVLVFLADGTLHHRFFDAEGHRLEAPKGLCPGPDGNAWLVTAFPGYVLKVPFS